MPVRVYLLRIRGIYRAACVDVVLMNMICDYVAKPC